MELSALLAHTSALCSIWSERSWPPSAPRVKFEELKKPPMPRMKRFAVQGAKGDVVGLMYFWDEVPAFYDRFVLKAATCHAHEVVPPNEPVRLFFDFDGDIPSMFCERVRSLANKVIAEEVRTLFCGE